MYRIVEAPNHDGGSISLHLPKFAEFEDEDTLKVIDILIGRVADLVDLVMLYRGKEKRLEGLANIYHDLALFTYEAHEVLNEQFINDIKERKNYMSGVITEELLKKYSQPNTKIVTFNTKVVGTSFRNKEDIDAVGDGDYVLIEPEIGNEFDPFACKVIHNDTGSHIGYIMKQNTAGIPLSKEVWENTIRKGDLYIGRVTVTGGENGKQRGLNLQVKHLHVPQEGEE